MPSIMRNNIRYAGGASSSTPSPAAAAITISQEDFDKLSEEEKASGIYVIPEGEDLTAKNLFYDGSVTGLGNNVQDAIDEQNKNFDDALTWKLAGTVVGANTVSLPSKWNELIVHVSNDAKWLNTTINIIQSMLSDGDRYFKSGATDGITRVKITKSNVTLNSVNHSGEEVISASTMSVYYR